MYLGIEIGGTKLQLGVGTAETKQLAGLARAEVDTAQGADGIRRQILESARRLLREHPGIGSVGIGFGGPVDTASGRIVKSHHVSGWDGFPIVEWIHDELGLPAVLGNDCDVAALAEATLGAGRGHDVVLYVTVGTGIGGGLVMRGVPHVGSGWGATELGHLRPGLDATLPEEIVEAASAGWGIARRLRQAVALALDESNPLSEEDAPAARSLIELAGGSLENLTAKIGFEAVTAGNPLAARVIQSAIKALGWAIAQTLTITGASVVVVGGGVSLSGEVLFLSPLRDQVATYVFPPFRDKYSIVPVALGEEVVVHGALRLASAAG